MERHKKSGVLGTKDHKMARHKIMKQIKIRGSRHTKSWNNSKKRAQAWKSWVPCLPTVYQQAEFAGRACPPRNNYYRWAHAVYFGMSKSYGRFSICNNLDLTNHSAFVIEPQSSRSSKFKASGSRGLFSLLKNSTLIKIQLNQIIINIGRYTRCVRCAVSWRTACERRHFMVHRDWTQCTAASS